MRKEQNALKKHVEQLNFDFNSIYLTENDRKFLGLPSKVKPSVLTTSNSAQPEVVKKIDPQAIKSCTKHEWSAVYRKTPQRSVNKNYADREDKKAYLRKCLNCDFQQVRVNGTIGNTIWFDD